MASQFPGRPKLLKGAFAVYTQQTPGTQPQIIVFQYNPAQMSRTLAKRNPPADAAKGGAAKEDVLRVPGPPVETIKLAIELDATDQLAAPDQHENVALHGLHPALAVLELMLYPPSLRAQELESLLDKGEVQVSQEELPLVLLVWGEARVVPVLITSFTVAEEAFDKNLNPIRAKVDVGLQVLTYIEYKDSSLGRDAFVAYQQQKEQLAGKFQNIGDSERIQGLLPEQSQS